MEYLLWGVAKRETACFMGQFARPTRERKPRLRRRDGRGNVPFCAEGPAP